MLVLYRLYSLLLHCRFVTLDTSSKDDMMSVMFALRAKKFASGERVQARLKSATVVLTGSDAGAASSMPAVPSLNPSHLLLMNPYYNNSNNSNNNSGGRKNKKKKNQSPKNKGNPINNNSNPNNNTSSNTNNSNKAKSNTNRRNNAGKQKKNNVPSASPEGSEAQQQHPSTLEPSLRRTPPTTQKTRLAPPALGEEQFPALPTEFDEPTSNKIELEKVPDDERLEDDCSYDELEKNRAMSDGASTATTSSSSSSSKPQTQPAIGGYAAALLKSAPKPQPEESSSSRLVVAENGSKKGVEKKKTTKNDALSQESTSEKQRSRPKETFVVASSKELTPVVVTPPSWGGGRSFADVLKERASVAAVAEQRA